MTAFVHGSRSADKRAMMREKVKRSTKMGNDAAEIVNTALGSAEGCGLEGLLKCLSRLLDSYGCVIWEDASRAFDGSEGKLFTSASWFPGDRHFFTDDLPIGNSATGLAIQSEARELVIDDMFDDPRMAPLHDLHRAENIRSVAILAFEMQNRSDGALALYRQAGAPPFGKDDLKRLRQFVKLVPPLYESMRTRISHELIQRVDNLIGTSDGQSPSRKVMPPNKMRSVLRQIAAAVGSSFDAFETSIILEDRLNKPGSFELWATTWDRQISKTSYRAHHEDGATGWVLEHKLPKVVPDLSNYQDIQWTDRNGIEVAVRTAYKLKLDDRTPPLSWMAAPIFVDGKVAGVIRCCTRIGPPSYYFNHHDLDLLTHIASQVSRLWEVWMSRRRIEFENETFRKVTSDIAKVGSGGLATRQADIKYVFKDVLRLAQLSIPEANLLNVRLHDPNRNDLYMAEFAGDGWNDGTRGSARKRRYPLNGTSSGAHVFGTEKTQVVEKVSKTTQNYVVTHPDVKWIITAPIAANNKMFGVLDVNGTGKPCNFAHAKLVSEFLGYHLGLYLDLSEKGQKLQDAQADAQRSEREQAEMFQDLGHQLHGPLAQSHIRLRSIVDAMRRKTAAAQRDVSVLSGLIRKAERVAHSLKLFENLRTGKAPTLDRIPLDEGTLIRMLIEAAEDNESMVEPGRKIRFEVDRESFLNIPELHTVRVDFGLLEQAVNNLLDNAGKYSYSNTTVTIYGGRTQGGRGGFHISVANRGIQIRGDAAQCKKRGYRSPEADIYTGEGFGIGLWVVDEIMKAHHGDLEFDLNYGRDPRTHVKLIFR